MERGIASVKQTKKQWLLWLGRALVVVALFGAIYWLNNRTILLWDDFDYSFDITTCLNGDFTNGQRLSSVGDILRSQATHRQYFGGRNVVHFLAQFFLMLGNKQIFNVANSLVYLILVWAVWANSGFQKKRAFAAIPLIFALLFYLPRHFNQSALWLTGSCNYLWGITLVMVAMVPFTRQWFAPDSPGVARMSRPWAAVPYGIFCFFAGWTNENTGFALPMMMLCFMLANRFAQRKNPRWMPCAMAAALAGYIVLFVAPGNWNRMDVMVGDHGSQFEASAFLGNFFSMTTILIKRYSPMLLLGLAACLGYYWLNQKGWVWKEQWKVYVPAVIFGASCLGSVYAMLVSPSFSPRVWFGIVALLVTAVGASVALIVEDRRFHILLVCAAVLLVPKFAVDYKNALEDINNNTAYWSWCEQEIETAKSQGRREIVLPMHHPVTVYSHAGYFTEDPHEWPNTMLAKWYDMDEIGFSSKLEDPFEAPWDFG